MSAGVAVLAAWAQRTGRVSGGRVRQMAQEGKLGTAYRRPRCGASTTARRCNELVVLQFQYWLRETV